MRMKSFFLAAALTIAAAPAEASTASEFAMSNWLSLIGVTDQLQAAANNGSGVVYGVIDTGAQYKWTEFGGRVNTSLSACTISGCSSSYAINDNNGHGTFVTSELIAAKNGSGIVGITPSATAIEIKALDATGSGYVSDVAKGIRLAVDKGAQILNLSLTFVPTSDLISAINYAASKNAVIVFAGGNAAQAFQANAWISGLTDAAAKRIFFMGSTNASKSLSTFSNTPGTGGFVSTSGTKYAFDTMWLMADGENIWGASNYYSSKYGYAYYTQMSGTSMAAPQGAGAAGLLVARWPFLLNTGAVVPILMQTGTDLGSAGVDTVYGEGFLNVYNAFQPIGTLQVANASGVLSPVSGTAVLSTGAAGTMPGITKALSGTVVYDKYNRDYKANISSSIASVQTSSVTSASALMSSIGKSSVRSKFVNLGDGNYFAMSLSDDLADGNRPDRMPSRRENVSPFFRDPVKGQGDQWSMSYLLDGIYAGSGHGVGVAQSFDEARWGERSAFADTDASASSVLLGLVPVSNYASVGVPLAGGDRMSFSVSKGEDTLLGVYSPAAAQGMSFGYTFLPNSNPDWKVALTASLLDEKDMLLGSPSAGALSFGGSKTRSFGIATAFNLADGYKLAFDALYAVTEGSSSRGVLIESTSALTSMAFGSALSRDDFVNEGDRLSLTAKKPLRIYDGAAVVASGTGTDMQGRPVVSRLNASLVPDGSETDFGLSYQTPFADIVDTTLSVVQRFDAGNAGGVNDTGAMANLVLHF